MRYSGKMVGALVALTAVALMACAGTGKFYKLHLRAGDILTGTLESDIQMKTSRGAKLDLPANSIEEIDFGRGGSAEVTLRDGNEFEGDVLNKSLKIKLSATGKLEEISIDKIESFARD
ncbi:MAG: hypothetical protein OEZ32_07595 [Nitrospinota bacterium]|nr:hypothetical protein [Nitrospinota bacterium]